MIEIPTLIDGGAEFRPLGKPVEESGIGVRVDDHLAKTYPFLTRAQWQKRLEGGRLLVSGKQVKSAYRLRHGDSLAFHHPAATEPEVDTDIYPIWKLGHLMAFYKPPNLPMHENGPYRKNTFENVLRETFGRQWAFVHRLDKETSGIVVCGDEAHARRQISMQWQRGEVSKEYYAVCRGVPETDMWVDYRSIGNDVGSKIRIKKWVCEDGLSAETHFQVLEAKKGYFLVSAMPKTGRTNQIRIHLAASGYPIVGDKLYHDSEEVFLEYFEKGATPRVIERAGHYRLCLHAARVSFVHPETKQFCTITSDLPLDIQQLWDSI